MNKYQRREQYSSGHSYRDSARKRRNALVNKAYSHAEKARRGCQLTGLKYHPSHLEWHHLENKRRELASFHHSSPSAFRAEMMKCVCLLADIHTLVHQGEIDLDDHEIIPP
jgi:hypothetical protein